MNNKKPKTILVLMIGLLMVIVGQYIYYSSDISNRVVARNQISTELENIKIQYQIDEINQVDQMNREIMQAQYDLDVMRKEKQVVYDTIQTPSDLIANPQNHYEIIDGVVTSAE